MRRAPLLVAAVPAGLAVGFLAWFVAGGAAANGVRLDALQRQVSALRAPRLATGSSEGFDVASLAAAPLFVMTTGPGAVPQPSVRLDGVSRSKGRAAALLSINDRPAEWVAVGEERDGVALQQVQGGKVVVETVYGALEVALGERVGGSPAATVSPPAVAAAGSDAMPPGARAPLPPASAPRLP